VRRASQLVETLESGVVDVGEEPAAVRRQIHLSQLTQLGQDLLAGDALVGKRFEHASNLIEPAPSGHSPKVDGRKTQVGYRGTSR
jgi:hypothetical protein